LDACRSANDASFGFVSEDAAALLARAKLGDVEAFETFVRVHERRVRGLLARMLPDDRDVDEAAQDTFVQAWRSLDRWRGDAAPFTWLYRIAVNEALQRTRRRAVETRPLEDAPAGGPDALAAAEAGDLSSFLVTRLRALRPDLRIAVVLRDIEGLSNREVADVLGLSVPAAKSRIHRARMLLRKELEQFRPEPR